MNYAQQQRNPVRQGAILLVVLAFQALLIWAIMNGLGHAVVDLVKPPIATKIIEEHHQPPPPPPPPPPPTLAPPPPPFIPPPDIQIQQPPPPKAIQTVTRTPPPTPPPPGPVSSKPNPTPSVPDHDVGERPLNGGAPSYPDEMQDQGREGSVNVTCDVGTDGKTSNCQVSNVEGGSAFARSAMDFVSTRRYSPRVHNGVAEPSRHTFHITYRLGSE